MDGVTNQTAQQMDKSKLLMLGLNLLNKLKLPCAVVAPQTQAPPPSTLPVDKPTNSPVPPQPECDNRKRKRDSSDDDEISEAGKREKRLVV